MSAVIMTAVLSGYSQTNKKSEKSEAAIRQVIRQVEAGWNAHDGKAFAAPFAEDADYVIVNGMHVKGREAIDKGHAEIFASIYKDSKNTASIKSIRFLRPDIAAVHIEWNLEYTLGGQKRSGRAMNTMLMTNNGGKWSIAAFQNTPIETPGHLKNVESSISNDDK